MNIRRIQAIFIKEVQDIRTNWNQIVMYVLPIGITLIYSKVIPKDQLPKGMAISMGLLMLVTMAGLLIPAMMIAEEKEKKTLEALLLSPARPAEIFLGKSLVTLLSILICMFILLLIDGVSLRLYLPVLISTVLASACCILFGIIIGLLSKNQMSTGVAGTPFTFLFLLPPLFAVMGMKQFEGVSRVVPTYYYLDLLKKITYNGFATKDLLFGSAAMAGFIVLSYLFLLAVYKKKGFE